MRILLLILGLLLFSCGILEPEAQIGDPKSVTFVKDGFTCQASAVTYAVSKWAASKDEWHLLFSATVSRDSSNTKQGILVEFVILDKSIGDEVEFIPMYLGHSWNFGESREDNTLSNTIFSTSEIYKVVWSAKLAVL